MQRCSPEILEFIDDMLCRELEMRKTSRISSSIRQAGFPRLKDFSTFNWNEVTMPEQMDRNRMLELDFMNRKETLVFYGVCGSGKTFLATELGLRACRKGLKVKFLTLSDLAVQLSKAVTNGTVEKTLAAISRFDLLIIDEWGYTQLDRNSAQYVCVQSH